MKNWFNFKIFKTRSGPTDCVIKDTTFMHITIKNFNHFGKQINK